MKTSWSIVLFLSTFLCFAVAAPLVLAAPLQQNSAPIIFIDELIPNPADPGTVATIQLSDGGQGSTPLTGLVLLFSSSQTETIIAAYTLDDYQTDEDGLLQLHAGEDFADANLANVVQEFDIIIIAEGHAEDFPIGAVNAAPTVVDGVLFSTETGTARSVLRDNSFQITKLHPQSISQASDSTIPASPDQGSENQGTVPPSADGATIPAVSQEQATIPATDQNGDCGTTATLIHEIQGDGATSQRNNDTITVEGIVAGDFQNRQTQLRGFFVQEEGTDFDDDATTSEGIYVFDNGFGVDVAVGDLVRVSGQVAEYNTMTELKWLDSVIICSHGNPVEPVPVSFPLATADEMEQYEGMLIRIDSPMQVAQNYFLGRYGQITIVAEGRAYQPTNLHPPGSAEAVALAAENARRLLIVDDGQDIRALGDNPNPVPYLGTPPDAIVRAGDTITNLVGVIDFGRINSAPGSEVGLGYRLQPTEPPSFSPHNLRTLTPPDVGGTLKVASFNVLNYFNGDGNGSGFPTSRGAKSAAEFERQRVKIIAALSAMNADVIGLMEIENDGYGPDSALQDLVNGLNEAAEAVGSDAVYAFVDPGLDQLGADEIAVGILYNRATVTPVGSAATLSTGAFDQELADFGRSRQPLAQTFQEQNGEGFTLVVNHFKSKRPSGEPDESNIDHGDGAGSWNGRRTEAANELIAWLNSDPTGSGDPDFLVVGDLNAYAKETPITAFEEAGYINLIAHFGGNEAYSYVYDGQLGYLDHALAAGSLMSQTVGALDWHINADEAKVLDYDAQFNPPGYYQPDPFRSSDHDPVLIGLTLADKDDDDDSDDHPPTNEELVHIVFPGETLSSIARRYSVTVAALAEANYLYRWSFIYPNQRLTIPPTPDIVVCVRTIFSEPGEPFIELAERFGADPDRLAFANGLSTINKTVDGQPICLPSIY